ncbi:hypothetical protein ACFOSC_23980 [Streptantibioticus rubrisoli]|uniref:MgtC-like C-terminal domain-containing protein n=1 Tax=Streptantibioticus rubrisoli TaxID=1387313 RepID=A0ABT1PHC4_9ACTN|nr:hypothetical protein [Streptantibioticus rubrisoli]MCQ4044768.1 hypothetical protein [Streptantibioticus rubrisoli]
MYVLDRLLLGSVERLVDRTPSASADFPVQVTVHTVCDAQAEAHVRTLLTQALSGPGVPVPINSRTTMDGSATLEASVTVNGPAAAPMARVLTHVWLEPGVQAVRWELSPTG